MIFHMYRYRTLLKSATLIIFIFTFTYVFLQYHIIRIVDKVFV
jgi:hypothetical protein